MKKFIKTILAALAITVGHVSYAAEPIAIGQTLEINLKAYNGAVLLEFDTTSNTIYQVEFSSDALNWDLEGYSFRGTGGRMSRTASGRGFDHAFFRVRIGGDPQNAPIANPSREWVVETTNRSYGKTYTNAFGYEINMFIRVGVSSSPDSGASWPILQTRKLGATSWLIVGGTGTSSRFLQQLGSINAVVPGKWEYRLILDGSVGWSLPISEWNELK